MIADVMPVVIPDEADISFFVGPDIVAIILFRLILRHRKVKDVSWPTKEHWTTAKRSTNIVHSMFNVVFTVFVLH